jgi:hypothetical protein
MKYIIVFLCSILLPIFSLKKSIPKLCVNCKFFIKDPENGLEHGKCSLFPTEESTVSFLVTGYKNIDNYYYCLTARQYESMCGKEGVNYEENPNKKECLKGENV